MEEPEEGGLMLVDNSAFVYRMETIRSTSHISSKANCDHYRCPEVLWRENPCEGWRGGHSCKPNTEKKREIRERWRCHLPVHTSSTSSRFPSWNSSFNFPESFALIRLDASLQRPHHSSSLLLRQKHHQRLGHKIQVS